jgi:hypothetical protein
MFLLEKEEMESAYLKKEYFTVFNFKFCKYTQILRVVMGNVYLFK